MHKQLLYAFALVLMLPLLAQEPTSDAPDKPQITKIAIRDDWGIIFNFDPQDLPDLPDVQLTQKVCFGYDDEWGQHHRVEGTVIHIWYA